MGPRRLAATLLIVILSATLLSGCNYLRQRSDDFRDIWVLSIGGTHTMDVSAVIPPSLGVYADALWFGAGAITHNGGSLELLDGRGTFIGVESRTRIGLILYQWWRIHQAYEGHTLGDEIPDPLVTNRFKDPAPLDPAIAEWLDRTSQNGYTRWLFPQGRFDPRKRLIFMDDDFQEGWVPLLRGWNHLWTAQLQAAAGFPLTHISFYVRAGFDVSEVMDFILGLTTYDMYRDDVDYSLSLM
ncbi:hypothetical protein JXA47_10635 [Candidatus Sumerlaeota bacterium]|nr:hypothetical protein [Candidatus Sumerlaeota bacterium]